MTKSYIHIILTLILLTCHQSTRAISAQAQNDRRLSQLFKQSSEDLHKQAISYIDRHEPDSAMICLTIMAERIDLPEASSVDKKLGIRALGNMAYIYSTHNFEKAYLCLDQAIDLSLQYKFKENLPTLYNNMGCLMQANDKIRQPKTLSAETADYFRKAYYAAKEERQWDILLSAFNNIAGLAVAGHQTDAIDDLITDLPKLQIPTTEQDLLLTRLHGQGVKALQQNNYQEALRLFQQMEQLCAQRAGQLRLRLVAIYDIGAVYELMKDPEMMIHTYRRGLALAQKGKENDVVADLYRDLSDCYEKTGNKELSDAYHLKYLCINDTLYYQNRLLNIEHLQLESKMRTANREKLQLIYEKRRQTLLTKASCIIATLMLALLALTFYHYRRTQRTNRDLYLRYRQVTNANEESIRNIQHYEQRILQLEARYTKQIEDDTPPTKKYRNSNIDDDTKDTILLRIIEAMGHTEEFCKEDFSIARLAEMVGWKQNYVSQVINERLHKSFSQMLMEYRIKEACKRMDDAHLGITAHYSVEGIASSVGYKSRTTFAQVFKRVTGLTPSDYLKTAQRGQRDK